MKKKVKSDNYLKLSYKTLLIRLEDLGYKVVEHPKSYTLEQVNKVMKEVQKDDVHDYLKKIDNLSYKMSINIINSLNPIKNKKEEIDLKRTTLNINTLVYIYAIKHLYSLIYSNS